MLYQNIVRNQRTTVWVEKITLDSTRFCNVNMDQPTNALVNKITMLNAVRKPLSFHFDSCSINWKIKRKRQSHLFTFMVQLKGDTYIRLIVEHKIFNSKYHGIKQSFDCIVRSLGLRVFTCDDHGHWGQHPFSHYVLVFVVHKSNWATTFLFIYVEWRYKLFSYVWI